MDDDIYCATDLMPQTRRALMRLFTESDAAFVDATAVLSRTDTVFYRDLLIRVVWSAFVSAQAKIVTKDGTELAMAFLRRAAECYGAVPLRVTGCVDSLAGAVEGNFPLTCATSVRKSEQTLMNDEELAQLAELRDGFGFAIMAVKYIDAIINARATDGMSVSARHFLDELAARLLFDYGNAFACTSTELKEMQEKLAAERGAADGDAAMAAAKKSKGKKGAAYDCMVWLPAFVERIGSLERLERLSPRVKALLLNIRTSFTDKEELVAYRATVKF
jgi:hypothetical protein